MLKSQEFEISTDVEELFQTHRGRSKPLRKVPREKPPNVSPTETSKENSFETASTDYENQLRNHIQKSERYGINNQVKKSQVLLKEGEDDPVDLRDGVDSRDHVDSRKKHLEKYIYRQDDKAVMSVGDHSAVYAQNILHQMSQVRHVREQVHGQLMSGFSQQELRLKPTVQKIKKEQERTSNNEDGSMFASRLSGIDRNGRQLWQQPTEEGQHSDIVTTTGPAQMSPFKVSESVSPPLKYSSILKNGDNVYDCHNVPQEESPDNLEDDMTFDLGALQEAAKQGDDILRKYIQSLSKNLKKMKLLKETDTLTSQNYVITDLGDGEYENDQCLPSEMVSNNVTSTKRNLRVDAKKKEQYKPKVSQPSVTSVELETLGLFEDLKSNMHHSSAHDAEDLDIQRSFCHDQGARLKGNAEENSNEDDDLGFRTHRPQERSFSPLKQIHMFNEIRQTHDQDEQIYSTGSDVIDDHHNLGGLTEHELSINKDDGGHTQVDLSFHYSDSPNGQNMETVDTDIDCFFSADAHKNCHTLEKEQSRADQAGVEEFKDETNHVPSFSNGQPISEPKTTDIISSTPFPHPLGTEIGNFLCSGQSTDSDQDPLIKNSSLKPKPPQDEKKSTNIKRHRPKSVTEIHVKNNSPRRPKTPEQHISGVREHHEKKRDNRRQLSSRKSPPWQTQLRDIRESTSPERGREKNPNNCLELNEASLKNYDDLKVDDIFKTSHWQGSEKPVDVFQDGINHVSIGPAGDAPKNVDLQNQTVKLCPVCNSFDKDVYSKCEVCSSNFLDISTNPVDLHIPPFVDKLDFSLPAVSERTDLHVMSGSAWDIEVTDQRHDGNVQRNGEDNESTVMGKIAKFVPKLTTNGGGDFLSLADSDGVGHGNQLDERGVGEGREVTSDLPDRVNTWLAANETGRLSHDASNPSRLNIHENHHSDESVEGLAAQGVTFDLPHQADLLRENGKMSDSDEHLVKIKPRPSSAGPQRSRQVPVRPKSSISKSRTGQLIDQPMYNRRWATSSSTWGSKRSVGDSLQVGGQRSPMIESITTSSSPITQRKRPSSAKHGTPPRKSDIEPGVRGKMSRPKSANWKSRDSKDLKEGMNRDMKETFLAVNSAQLKDGLASRALNTNSSNYIPPLTLQLMCDSPRGGDGLSIWELLPDEILLHIFSYLNYNDLIHCAVSCSRFHCIAMDDTLWRTIRLHKRQLTDFWLTQIGERHPVNLSITQCHGNIVTDNGLRNLFRSCADTLQELNVSGCTGGELVGDSLLLHASRCQHLTSLDASWCQVTDNGLTAITDSCKRLTSLCLNGCQSVSDECLNKVITKHGKSLYVLEVLGCLQLSPETLQLIGKECCHLHTLNIGQCYKVTDDCITQLASHLRNLKHLDLRGCKQIRDTCVRKIVRNCKRLMTLVLANCTNITNAAIIEIATYLSTIRSLDVSGCKKVNNEGVRSLATCCHHLTSLDVSSTGVDHKSVSALANYCNKTLVSVRFNCCKDITEVATIKLLKNCKKLKTLHLYGVKGLRNLSVLKLQYPCLQFG